MEIGVLVTAVGSGSTGEQVVKALRRGRRPYRLVVTNLDLERSVVAGEATRTVLPPASDPGYLAALAGVAEAHGVHFIVPGCDPELVRMAAGRAELARLTRAVPLANGIETIQVCQHKGETAAALARAGLRAPRTVELGDGGDPAELVARGGLRYPVILKPHRGGGSADVHVAQDAAELRHHAERALLGGPALAQEYVGDAASEFTVGVLHYPDGRLGGSVALRRDLSSLLSTRSRVPNRTGRAELGRELVVSSGVSQGRVDDYPEVRAAAERAASAVGSRGPVNVQGRLSGGELVVFEINPRFSGTEAMRAMAGWNAPEALIDWHLGLRPELEGFRARPMTFIRTTVELRLEGPPARPAGPQESAAHGA